MAKLSDRIKSLRLSANMTQEEFGNKFGIVKSTVSLYESGKSTPNDQIKKQICDYFHVSFDYLLGIDTPTETSSDVQIDKKDRNCAIPFLDDFRREVFAIRLKTALASIGLTEDEFTEQSPVGSTKSILFLTKGGDPTADDLIELSQFLETSIDYLLGQIPKVNNAEKKILNTFVKLNTDNQDIIIGKAKELLKEQQRDTVAAGTLKKTGTDNTGK